jgi:hypothetical protein
LKNNFYRHSLAKAGIQKQLKILDAHLRGHDHIMDLRSYAKVKARRSSIGIPAVSNAIERVAKIAEACRYQ